MPDHETTVADLKQIVNEFIAERHWEPFHTPKNLAMALSIEAAELMEHFQWLTPEQSLSTRDEPEKRGEIEEELADVLCYILSMASTLGIDLSDAMRRKMVKNREKYPAEAYRDCFGPDDPNFRAKND